MREFCTYFDRNYLVRGLALHHSLLQHCPDFRLWILCMDTESHEILKLKNLPHTKLISLSEIEDHCPALLRAKPGRSRIEYYFTCTPALPLFVLDRHPEVMSITYLDADLFFFTDPAPLYDEIEGSSIAIIEHRFPPELMSLMEHGIYNVGFLFFHRDKEALACLRDWLEQCVDWCYDYVDGDRFADQKYLNDWPNRFQNLAVIQHKGANLAPWNLSNYGLQFADGQVTVDQERLIFFHFHDLKRIGSWLYDPNFAQYKVNPSHQILRRIYKPYLKVLSRLARRDQRLAQLFMKNSSRGYHEASKIGLAETCRRIWEGRYIFFVGGPSAANGR